MQAWHAAQRILSGQEEDEAKAVKWSIGATCSAFCECDSVTPFCLSAARAKRAAPRRAIGLSGYLPEGEDKQCTLAHCARLLRIARAPFDQLANDTAKELSVQQVYSSTTDIRHGMIRGWVSGGQGCYRLTLVSGGCDCINNGSKQKARSKGINLKVH